MRRHLAKIPESTDMRKLLLAFGLSCVLLMTAQARADEDLR
jgi:hypothetical protein